MLLRLRDPSIPAQSTPVKPTVSVSTQCDLPLLTPRAKRTGGPPSRSLMDRRPLKPRSPNITQPVSSQSDISVPSSSSSITVIDEEEASDQKENLLPVRNPPTGGLQAVLRRHRFQNSFRSTGQSATVSAAEPVTTTSVSATNRDSRLVTASPPVPTSKLTSFIDLTGDDSDDSANVKSTAVLPPYHYRSSKGNVTLPNAPTLPRDLESHPAPSDLSWKSQPVPSLFLSNRKIDGRDVEDYYTLVASASRSPPKSTGVAITPCPKPSFAVDLDVNDLYGDLGSLDTKPALSPVKMPTLNPVFQPGPSGLATNNTASLSTGVLDVILTSDEDDDTPLPSILSSITGHSASKQSLGKKRSSTSSLSAEDPTVRKRTNTKRRPM